MSHSRIPLSTTSGGGPDGNGGEGGGGGGGGSQAGSPKTPRPHGGSGGGIKSAAGPWSIAASEVSAGQQTWLSDLKIAVQRLTLVAEIMDGKTESLLADTRVIIESP